ncbi:unnamed protein product [Rotaria socialis]|uniref:Uncharacterized protein n=1 Tax=Rotaria socialis TaxID=392032 RepID=A0A817TF00_9BILA|nr:unnamed protein product [Rotaria socialis]CAF3344829.1 unnamed protein product [Rotaria socialis]CAF3357925.1 unnamed protein product [Rotaria socialis]CAF3378291.1 unnamed protein product [Rotaria socialis]CAF4344884.1 unnamed protein product [Rotaria socialis]
MVEPVTLILGVVSVINFLSTGFTWFKKFIGAAEASSPSQTTLSVATYPSVIYVSPIREDTAKTEFEHFKSKKKSLENFDSNDGTSSSNFGSTIGLLLVVSIVLAVLAFIFYRTRSKSQENRFSFFRQSETKCGSLPTLRTSQIESNPVIV